MIRVALVGCGFMGRMHATVYSLLDNAELVAVCDHRESKAQAFSEQFGCRAETSFEQLLSDPSIDAIDICLPTHLHAVRTIEAASAGKHVLCEKPMALCVEDAQSMKASCDQAGVRLMIGHCIRFWPEYAYLKDLVASQRLGRLTSLNLTRYGAFPSWSSDNWLADEDLSGGGALDMHIHDTDFALYLLGEPKAIASRGTTDSRGLSQIYSTFDYGQAVVHLQGGWNLPPNTPFKMAFRAIFENGVAIMDGGPLFVIDANGETETPHFEAMATQGGGNISDLGGYYHEIKYFVDGLESGQPFTTVTPDTSLASLQTALQEIALAKANHLQID